MAEYLGVPNGLMVRQVARKSEAAVAGLRAFDVILKVGRRPSRRWENWERALHAHRGRQVQVTVLREPEAADDHASGRSKHCGKLEFEQGFPAGDIALLVQRLTAAYNSVFYWYCIMPCLKESMRS